MCGVAQVNEHERAEQLRGAIERLGPAYVKVAQALSTRVDLLSPEYLKQVQLLQDRVPPFPCEQATEVCNSSCTACTLGDLSWRCPLPRLLMLLTAESHSLYHVTACLCTNCAAAVVPNILLCGCYRLTTTCLAACCLRLCQKRLGGQLIMCSSTSAANQ